MRMYGIRTKGVNSTAVAVVKANTPAQATNVYARRVRNEVEATVLKPEDVYELCVKGGLPLHEPEAGEAESEAGEGESTGDGKGE